MDGQGIVGSRIRQRRIDKGLRQADVAANAGISASYLNLIEHNKRRISEALLQRLAEILGATPQALSAGGDAAVLDGMRSAASRFAKTIEVDRVDDIAAWFPGWAALIADQDARIMALEKEVQVLSDRMGQDPALAEALHDVITSVTSIRATAGILVSGDRVDADWQRRFHTNLHADSQRLTEQSKSLMAYLDQPEVPKATHGTNTLLETVDDFLAGNSDVIAAFDADANASVDQVMKATSVLELSTDVQLVLRRRLQQHAEDVAAMPFAQVMEMAIHTELNPAAIASAFDQPLPSVFRRLAYLPDHKHLPPRGLAVCDAAGVMTCLKPAPGFHINRRSDCCPLWPIFVALRQIGQPLRQEVVLPSATSPRLLCYAQAIHVPSVDFSNPLHVTSTMLVISDPRPGEAPEVHAGTNCRICTRSACPARREPALTGDFS